jgi:hypothetical protein
MLVFLINDIGSTMNTISSLNETQTGNVAPKLSTPASPTASSFSETLATAQARTSLLTSAESSWANRPNLKQFMDRTGIEFLDASDLIYGVIGSNTDVRDWSQIMASNDPVTAVRQATAEMYGRTNIEKRTDATYMEAADTVAKEGNFSIRLLKDEEDKVVDEGLKITDAQGLILRDAGKTPEQIARNAWLFGLSTQPLVKLVDAAAKVSDPLATAVSQASVASIYQPQMIQTVTEPASIARAQSLSSLTTTPAVQEVSTKSPTSTSKLNSQVNDSGTSPQLSDSIQEATQKTLSELDTVTYLNSLLK